MKNYLLYCLLTLMLSACGQAGPLYLPGTPPPIHVPKEEKENTEQKTTTEKTETETEKNK